MSAPEAEYFASPIPLEDLPTPSLLLDEERMEANARRMAAHLGNMPLRPHLKTCRCWDVAQRMMKASACTVATMGEAEAVAELGVRDILLAVGIRPSLFARARALMAMGIDFKVILDSLSMARALIEDAKGHSVSYSVLLEIDTDGHRAGLKPDGDDLCAIARLLAEAGQRVRGVLTHAGAAYNCKRTEEILALAEKEGADAVAAAERLRAMGLDVDIVSAGSTPTALLGTANPGLTEVRAGVYIYMDMVQAGLGVCRHEDIALSVLTSVIGGFAKGNELPSRICTDSGWASLSSDRGLDHLFQSQGYGLVCDMELNALDGLVLYDLNQEHGMVRVAPDLRIRERDFVLSLSPKSRLRILPNHACATAMMHKYLYLVRDAHAVARLPLFGGW